MAVVPDPIEAVDGWEKSSESALYNPDDEAKEFFKKETGITDDEELKQHILRAQAKALAMCPYPCIRAFEYIKLHLARHPAYPDLCSLGKQRPGAIFLDLGCCFGHDSRKAIQDGYPIENVVASDLRGALWEAGHELFRSTPETFPVPFLEGDALDPAFLAPVVPFTLESPPSTPRPDLKALTSLNPLRGHVSAIYVGSFIHLFPEETQTQIARSLAGLLSPEPGSMLLGVHGGQMKKGFWSPTNLDYKMFCHSPESWKELWEEIFGKGKVEVKVGLKTEAGGLDFFGTFPGNKEQYYRLEYSVTRL